MNIHFICRGNVLRSLIAETYTKSLNLDGIEVLSSGTNVNWEDPLEREYFTNTLTLLRKHGLVSLAKSNPEQLTQQRLDTSNGTIVLMNKRVVDEAMKIVELPMNILNWNITDIGEGTRTDSNNRELYEEQIYQEIVQKIDELVEKLGLRS